MLCNHDDSYNDLAAVQLRFLHRYSPNAAAILEKIYPYGAQAVYQAAFATTLYESTLESSARKPGQFDYYCFVQDYPQVLSLLDQAINSLIEDWLMKCKCRSRS